jgi:hypothetical protein
LFVDDNGSLHEGSLNRAAAAGVFRGCNPPRNDIVCHGDTITRGQVAAVLVRALGLESDTPVLYTDAVALTFFDEIGILGGLGVTVGCNPPANDAYCPDPPITRGQMAAMLHRTSELESSVQEPGIYRGFHPATSSLPAASPLAGGTFLPPYRED